MSLIKKTSRRGFLKSTAIAGAGVALPSIVPSYVLGQDAPSDKINVGIIGLGWRGSDLLNGAIRNPNLQVAALCDVDRPFLLHAMQRLDDEYDVDREWIQGRGGSMSRADMPKKAVEGYHLYERMLQRKDIDAMMIAVPDHWHAKAYIDSMNAGFDVYGEKPLTLTLNQGRAVVRTTRANNAIFQTGSQQRSDDKFRKGCEYVRSGRLGKISHVDVVVGGAPQKQGVPDEIIPPGLDWERLLGPAPLVPFNPLRSHVNFRWFFEYSGGMVTDWGAHHLDIMQWGLGMDGSGPLSIEGKAEVSPGYHNTLTSFNFTMQYPNDIKVHFKNEGRGGVTFFGEKGSVFVNRGKIDCDPVGILEEPLTASDVHLYKSNNHIQNWVDCVKSRELPITDVEIGHRSCSVCHIANICGKLGGRKLVWDAKNELFINDPEANMMLDYEERKGYEYDI